jgi:hypothetical protein
MTSYKATSDQWAYQEHWSKEDGDAACLLELRSRVEALESRYETQRAATLEWGKDLENLQRWNDQHLRRIEELEADRWLRQHAKPKQANSKPTPNPSQIRSSIQLTPEQEEAIAALLRPDHFGQVNKMVGGSLVERVQRAIHDVEFPHGNDEARAAIREVAAALREVGSQATDAAAFWLEQEAER